MRAHTPWFSTTRQRKKKVAVGRWGKRGESCQKKEVIGEGTGEPKPKREGGELSTVGRDGESCREMEGAVDCQGRQRRASKEISGSDARRQSRDQRGPSKRVQGDQRGAAEKHQDHQRRGINKRRKDQDQVIGGSSRPIGGSNRVVRRTKRPATGS